MPIVRPTFAPPRWLANGHIQTILPAVLPRCLVVPYSRERLELDDGDFLALDVLDGGHPRVVVISHGLEGSSRDAYVRGLASIVSGAGWNVVAWNYRGCGGEPNRLPRSYHSGDTDDLARVIERAVAGGRQAALVGFSLGGNLSLKFVGERPDHPSVIGAVGVSAPVDLASSAAKLDRDPANRIYLRRLIARLEIRVRAKAMRFPDRVRVADLEGMKGFTEFDDRFTAPMHGFRDAQDYWTRSSARPFLPFIRVPSLLLNALDDPFLAPACFPFDEAEASEWFCFEAPASGGHLGFVQTPWAKHHWAEFRIRQFLSEL
jgi:predicted alpha/beta-fold hydrolase